MIDMHIHAVPPGLPGVGSLSPLLARPADEVASALRTEMDASGCVAVMAMGSLTDAQDDPLGIAATLELSQQVAGLFAIGICNPFASGPDHFEAVRRSCASGDVIALKAYLGYVHCAPTDPRYFPYYEIAQEYRLPVIFHTGDTYSPYAKLKYAHPLQIDEVAVDFPGVDFVMAHLGNPWTIDAAEVIYKNMNVYADLSGLLVGGHDDLTAPEGREARADLRRRVVQAFRYAERPQRFLYGSDWPLAPMTAYRRFVEDVIPEEFHELVLFENARRLFKLTIAG